MAKYSSKGKSSVAPGMVNKPIMGPQKKTYQPPKYQKYVDPTSSANDDEMGMSSQFMEVVPVDMNFAYVPETKELTQEDKESPENLQKVLDTTMDRFGLKY